MVLKDALGVYAVLAVPQRRQAVEIVHDAKPHVVAVDGVLFDAQGAGLVGILSCSQRLERKLVEVLAFAVPGIDAELAFEKPEAITVVDAAAIDIAVSADVAHPVARLK